MSEVAQNMGDEPTVMGEPASQPHHAAVVGEPPEDMVPVLGEPVLLANGLQNDQQPLSSPSPDESANNGVHEESSPAAESPFQFSDAPSSTASNVESPNLTMTEEHVASEVANAEDRAHLSATESPIPSGSNTETSDARAQEVADTPDCTHIVNDAVSGADIPADVEVTHIADVPSGQPPSEGQISTENTFSVLDEGSPQTDLNVSGEGEEPTVVDVPGEGDEHEGESTKGLGASAMDSQEISTEIPATHEEVTKSLGSTAGLIEKTTPSAAYEEPTTDSEKKNVNDVVSEERNVSEPTKAEELSLTENKHVDTASKEFDVVRSSPKEADGGTPYPTKDLVSGDEKRLEDERLEESPTNSGDGEHVESIEASLPEGVSQREASTKEGNNVNASAEASSSEAEQVVNREAVLSKAFSSEKGTTGKEGGDDQAAPDSSLEPTDKDAYSEAFPMESSGLRALTVEASMGDQPPSNETSLGENGSEHGQDGIPLEREQCLPKDEKPGSRFKLPVLLTLSIAVVGVAVAAISRSRH